MSGPASDLLWGQVAEDLKDFLLNLSPDLSLETVAKELAKEFGISDSEAMDLATYGDRLNNTSPQFFSDFAKDLPVSGPHPSLTSKYGNGPYPSEMPNSNKHNHVYNNYVSGKYGAKHTKSEAEKLGLGTKNNFEETKTNVPRARPTPPVSRYRGARTQLNNNFQTFLSPGKKSGTDGVVPSFEQDISVAPSGPTTGVNENSGIGMFGEDYGLDLSTDTNSIGVGQDGNSDSTGSSSDGDYGDGQDWGGVDFGGWGFPVVLDLNNDGNVKIIPLSHSTARFDMAGLGSRQVLAWPGPEDALFIYDRDGDRMISHRDEIAFKDYLATAKTDLEGLAWFDQLAQGGNEDGVLDKRDAAWGAFGVWRDADQDGETDAGELRMTGEGGLKSLNLTSDQQPRDAGPDAKIFGKGTFEYFDRNGIAQTADAYDVALQYEKEKSVADALYPDMDVNKRPLPPLMRRDGQELSQGEKVYPMMGYDENIYEPWPDWAVARFLKHYPDQFDKLVSSRR